MRKMVVVNVRIDIKGRYCGKGCRFLNRLELECQLFQAKTRVSKEMNAEQLFELYRCKKCMELEPA